MAYIELIEPENATGLLKEEYDQALQNAGHIANILKVLSRSPSGLKTMMQTYMASMFGQSELSRAQREMLATVVSSKNECFYWTQSHGNDFRDEVKNTENAEKLKKDWRSADLNAGDAALCAWAEKLTLSPSKMTRGDVKELEAHGFSHDAISDAAQVIGFFNYINRIAEGLGVDLEEGMHKEND